MKTKKPVEIVQVDATRKARVVGRRKRPMHVGTWLYRIERHRKKYGAQAIDDGNSSEILRCVLL
jgi:hypothetical protein